LKEKKLLLKITLIEITICIFFHMIKSIKNSLYKKVIVVLLLFMNLGISQESLYEINLNVNPDKNDYWWLNNNNQGKYANKNIIDLKWKMKNQSMEYQLILSNGFAENQKFQIGESFIKGNIFKDVYIKLGKYYRDFSLYLNDNLSSGSMLISNNAEPMPKMGLIGKSQYNRNKNISFDWGISHGKFDKNEYYSQSPFLHEKFLYMNFKKNDQKFSVGLVHEAVWAGTTTAGDHQGKQPGKIKDFFKVFISADGPLREGEVHANALGNHLGIWDFYYQKNKNKNQILKLYYQHFFEDTSSLRFANKTDGLWGIELKNYISNTNILLEYLDTSNCCVNPPYQSDQYYYNYQYRAGWSYKNNILGNPFVNPTGFRSGNVELSKIVHIGLTKNIDMNNLTIQASRDTHISDNIKYKITFDREINKIALINIFLVGNEDSHGFGLGGSYIIK
tara:strand:- start:134 stop:1477 length:1344 start_codon:yes stop_codon:yes gene_type:complete